MGAKVEPSVAAAEIGVAAGFFALSSFMVGLAGLLGVLLQLEGA